MSAAVAWTVIPTAPDPEDARIVEAILAGDGEAFGELHEKYHGRIYAFALKRLRDSFDAEDVTQETFLQVHRSLASYEGRSALLSWMFGIAHNQVRRRFRKADPPRVSIESPEACAITSGDDAIDRQVELGRMLARCEQIVENDLSDAQREIFEMRFLDCRSTREIAEELGKSTQAVKISLFRSRKTLCQRTPQLPQVLGA